MKTLALVIEREYASRVKKKTFILFTILIPVLLGAMMLIPLWLSSIKGSEDKKIVVIDQTGLYAKGFKSWEHYQFKITDKTDTTDYSSHIGDNLYAILKITDDLSKNPNAVSLTSAKQVPLVLISRIEKNLSEKVTGQKLDQLAASRNADKEVIAKVRSIIESGSKISVSTLKLNESGNISEISSSVASIVSMVFSILIYMFTMIYGSMVLQAVMEEKRSRIVEVIISSMKPVKLLVGKIIAIGLVGFTQLFIWAILGGAIFIIESSAIGLSMDAFNIITILKTINWFEIFAFFIIFFTGGFILYASIFSVIGASVDNDQDVQQFMMPITILLLFAFYAGFYSVQNPDGPLAFWCSFIPFTSPIVMMVRIPFGIPFWQELISVVILYGSFLLISYLAAKIYRVGILMYGKKPTIKEFLKWLRYK